MISDQLIKRLTHATSVAVLTGAGISAESGVPTFRGPYGLWKKFKPEELANFDAFIGNPELVWEWYDYRRKLMHEVMPNAGHCALVDLEQLYSDFTLITQNVDNLHRRAGSKHVLELHGNIDRSFCIDCSKEYTGMPSIEKGTIPRCEHCNGLIRPDVVWFGEMLPEKEMHEAERAAKRAQVFFSIGTSGEVYPAAQLPIVAKSLGAYVVEINPERTLLSRSMDECIFAPSGEALPAILAEVFKAKSNIKIESTSGGR